MEGRRLVTPVDVRKLASALDREAVRDVCARAHWAFHDGAFLAAPPRACLPSLLKIFNTADIRTQPPHHLLPCALLLASLQLTH